MIAVVAVLLFAGAGIAVTVLSAVAARRPDRAAMAVVLGAAAGGMLVFPLALLGVLVVGVRGAGTGGPAVQHAVRYSPTRLTGGLALAVLLLALAGWLVRTGDWDRPEA